MLLLCVIVVFWIAGHVVFGGWTRKISLWLCKWEWRKEDGMMCILHLRGVLLLGRCAGGRRRRVVLWGVTFFVMCVCLFVLCGGAFEEGGREEGGEKG